jgi:D-sedoheptulose 7-phosphate isomerase
MEFDSVYDRAYSLHRAAFDALGECRPDIEKAAVLIIKSLESGGKFITAGNGGSAADAEHFATELVGRFLTERSPLPAVALTNNGALMTAIANDYGYAEVFSRQITALAQKGDVFFAISTSGKSENILRAIQAAKESGIAVIGLTSTRDETMSPLCDISIRVPSDFTPAIQEMHILIIHILCGMIEGEVL